MGTVCKEDMCTGCKACVSICPKGAISIIDSLSSYNAVIDSEKCINCNACHRVCQVNSKVTLISPRVWYQGWCIDDNVRGRSASGGLASELAQSFIKNGGFVYSCVYQDRDFVFKKVSEEDLFEKIPGSKYVKSNPLGVYESIKADLKSGEKVLFIGLPCQVFALKKYLFEPLQQHLFTVDLICHGSPSPKLLWKYLSEHGIKDIKNIRFRNKQRYGLFTDYESIVPFGIADRYMISFLQAYNYTENCYSCRFAGDKRTSDLTIGDSWGSALSVDEQKKGISLILCQSDKGETLLNTANVHLEAVNIENAKAHNAQLNAPEKRPDKRDLFFREIKKGAKYDWAVFKCRPFLCLKQDLKKVLFHFRPYRGSDSSGYRLMVRKEK